MSTLLVADDNLTVQRMIAMTFAAEDITVIAVADGDQAVALIEKDHPDIVLAATTTPKRTGYEVAAFVKSTPALASIPVLLLAGAFEAVDEVRAAHVRCDGVLVKPLEPQQVVTRVKELIAAAATRAAMAPSEASESLQRLITPSLEPGTAEESLDDYFERLDSAFNARATSTPRAAVSAADSGTVPTLDSVLNAPPTRATSPVGPATATTDALVDEVTRRVVERLGAAAIKDVVADVVADVAERLIREEIARIRGK